MIHFPRLFAAGVALVCCATSLAAAAARPNFIIINIDDLGYADIGPFGSNNRTPHLDRMAREGRRLTSHYAAPVCTPSRAALMTGSYPKRAMPTPGVLFPASAVGLHPNERTVAEVLKDAGYATACIGKWHLGDQPEFLPTRQGFDYYLGIPYSNDMGPAADGSKSNLGDPLPAPKQGGAKQGTAKKAAAAEDDGTGFKGMTQPPLPLLENEKVVDRINAPEQATITGRYAERAARWVREQRSGPFFLYLSPSAVHFPLYPSPQFRGKSPNGLRGDWVQEIDALVGRVLDTVRELKLEQNTLVIFTSDNGGPLNHGAKNQPLRGGKASTLEGGVRVSTIAWWPGRVPAGTSTDAITSMMDVLPTFAALAGARPPTDRKLDGVDVSSILLGSPVQPPRDQFYYFRGFTLEAVRSGPWKLQLGNAALYHLGNDIGEATNVAAQHPEIVQRLRALADATKDDLGLTGAGPGCRPLGRVEHPQPLIAADGTVRAGFAGAQKNFPAAAPGSAR